MGIAVATLGLMLWRPRRLNEAWATLGGAALMLALRLVTPAQAWGEVTRGADVLLFLLALMVLSLLLELAGFFEWAALHTARRARGSGGRLFRNVFLLGAACTVLLSLDTTAIILTPVVVAVVARVGVPSRPFLLTCAFVANTASLLLPVSNLTNLLYASQLHFSFVSFLALMAVPQLTVLAVAYAYFRWSFRHQLPSTFVGDALAEPSSAITDRPFFLASLAVLTLVTAGYFVGSFLGLPAYAVAGGGCVLLLGVGITRGRVHVGLVRQISWALFPFVVGLFIVVRGVRNLGLVPLAARALQSVQGHPLAETFVATFGAGLGSNVINNIPMALLSLEVLRHGPASDHAVYGSLIGCNLGPNLTVLGSLATMLVITGARRRGEDLGAWDFLRVGALLTPLLLAAGALALFLVLRLAP